MSCAGGSSVKGSGEVIRASAPYTSGWGSFVLLKMDHVRVAWGGSLSTLHRTPRTKKVISHQAVSGRQVQVYSNKEAGGLYAEPLSHQDDVHASGRGTDDLVFFSK